MWVLPTGVDRPDEVGNMSLGPEKTCVSNTGADVVWHPLVQQMLSLYEGLNLNECSWIEVEGLLDVAADSRRHLQICPAGVFWLNQVSRNHKRGRVWKHVFRGRKEYFLSLNFLWTLAPFTISLFFLAHFNCLSCFISRQSFLSSLCHPLWLILYCYEFYAASLCYFLIKHNIHYKLNFQHDS